MSHSHPKAAKEFLRDEPRVDWHDKALWHARVKRDDATSGIPEWEDLRQAASNIKRNVLANLDTYLEQFESNAKANGINVHWAETGAEHNEIVFSILKEKNARRLVKSKSMLTEECGLNPYLEKNGIDVTDTDLGERIVQLANEPPSHIVMPAIHKKKEEIDDLFHEKLGTERRGGDPDYLTQEARKHLRTRFLRADAALTGVNFAVAETGGFVVCTNEGNADMGVNFTTLHIASMGIEKIIPRQSDLGVFLRILARSATGQPITVYSSHFKRPVQGGEMHIVIVDNGRSAQLGRADFRGSLHCIRCGACMNTCPVYRRSGGYSYDTSVPGPIGSILKPGMDLNRYSSLPFASSLCGSCSDVCPVKIDIDEQLYKWRQIVTKKIRPPVYKKMIMKSGGLSLADPGKFDMRIKWALKISGMLPSFIRRLFNTWERGRKWPEIPNETFKDWYRKNR